MSLLLAITVFTIIGCVARGMLIGARLPEPVFFGADGFGCMDGAGS